MTLCTKIIKSGIHCTIRAIVKNNKEKQQCETFDFFRDIGKNQPQELSKILSLLSHTAKNGVPYKTQKFKKLKGTDDICEFKTTKLRLLCFYDKTEASLIVCTHGFLKKTQRTPRKEIEHAEQLKREYFNEKKKGTLGHEKQTI